MSDSNRLPFYFYPIGSLLGGLVGFVASAITWWMLGAFWWMPYWRQLRAHGMNADDNGWAMGFALVPPIVGAAFLISTLISLIAVRWVERPKVVLILINLIPGLLIALLGINGLFHGRYWENPGFETACLLIGFGWGACLQLLMARRSACAEG
jgi:hypothetical protein